MVIYKYQPYKIAAMPKLIKRILGAMRTPKPKTYVQTGSSKDKTFTERERNKKQLKRYELIYNQGGIVTEAINAYPMFITANGWRLEGPDNLLKRVEAVLDAMDFDAILWAGITDALVFGDAFQEKLIYRDKTPSKVLPRLASSFAIKHDDHGNLKGYTQTIVINGKEKEIPLKPDQIVHLQFWELSGSLYGHSLIHKAYDEILRDLKIAEATATAIHRHGFKKYHIRVGQEGESIEDSVLTAIHDEFKELDTKNDFVTPHDFEINSIDSGGLEKIDLYNDISIMRMAAALGVPEEILGLRRGSTDATASKRIETFYTKIEAMQKRVARCYTLNVIDQIVPPGEVKLEFNDANPEDTTKKARWIATIMKASKDPFEVLSQEWIQEQFKVNTVKVSGSALEAPTAPNHSGLVLPAPHAELIWRGIQKTIAKATSLGTHTDEPLYLIADGLCYGVATLGPEEVITQAEFQERSPDHMMADDASLCRKQKIFYYNVKLLSILEKPRQCSITEGARNYAKKVEFQGE